MTKTQTGPAWDSIKGYPETAQVHAHNTACSCAGEGEPTTPEALGIEARKFTFPELFILPIGGGYEIVYSMDSETSELGVELMRYNP